jgi:hydrogenase maturation protease
MILIIGYGNALFADDGFGPAVIDSLMQRLNGNQTIETASCRQLLPEFVEQIAKADTVIFVDANVRLLPAQFDFSPLELDKECSPSQSGGTSAHVFSASSLLNTVDIIYGIRPSCWLCSVGPVDLRLGVPMSAAVATLIPRAVAAILDKAGLTELARSGGRKW